MINSAIDESSSVFMARQPIFDRQGAVIAYELLFRNAEGRSVGKLSEQQEAVSLVRPLIDIGLDQLVGRHTAFVNVPSSLITHPSLLLLPADRVVLEIMEDIPPTAETIEAMRTLRKHGYKLALDDFVFDGKRDDLLPECQVVKVELPACEPGSLGGKVGPLKAAGLSVLAEKVETHLDLRRCMSAGCDMFQGYFFAKPELVKGSQVGVDSGALVQVLQELQDPDVSLTRVEQVLSMDARLTHQLLRMSHTAAMGVEVTSVRTAVLALGFQRLSGLVALMLMAERKGANNAVLTTGTIRAKLCEEVASILRYPAVDRHFTVGLLSVLDAVFGRPMAEVVEQIGLANDLKTALVQDENEGELANCLRIVKALERGRWSEIESLDIPAGQFGECYLRAIRWSEEIQAQMAS